MLDLVIDGTTVYPGDAPPFQGQVGVRGGEIVLVTQCHKDSPRAAANTVVDGRGLLLSPGFIDLHTHSALVSFDDPLLTPKLAQGFTTEVINPDGLSPAPVAPERRAERQAYLRPLEGGGPDSWPWSTVAEYLDALDETRPAALYESHDAKEEGMLYPMADRAIAGQRRAAVMTAIRSLSD